MLTNPDNFKTVEIEPGVFLGNITGAEDLTFYQTHGIKGIVNVSKDLPFFFQCNQLRICIDDNTGESESLHAQLDIASAFIEHNKPCLIHCYGGISRSPTVVAAYLMYKHRGLSPQDAVNRVKDKRNITFSWGHFYDTLNRYHSRKLEVQQQPLNRPFTHPVSSVGRC